MTTSNFTPLDSLKECAARGHLALSHALERLHSPDDLAFPDIISGMISELTDLHDLLAHHAFFAHVDPDATDREFYSDGRPVGTQLELEPGAVHQHIWSADPRSPRDQPQDVAVFRTPSDTVWRIVILRPGDIDAIRVKES
jgi:hypothetical protein